MSTKVPLSALENDVETETGGEKKPEGMSGMRKGESKPKRPIATPMSNMSNRPSAAALGFSTVHMTDAEVAQRMSHVSTPDPVPSRPKRKASPRKRLAEPKRKNKKPEMNESDDEDKMQMANSSKRSSSASSSSSSSSAAASTSSSSSTSEGSKKPGTSSDKLQEVREKPLTVRTEFPKNNIRRWMTPGSRYPISAMTVKSSSTSPKTTQSTLVGWLASDSGKEPVNKEDEEKKEERDEEKVEGEKPEGETLVIPRHRRRVKSFRNSTTIVVGRGFVSFILQLLYTSL